MTHWLRTQIFARRLYGQRGGSSEKTILSAKETMEFVNSLCEARRREHLNGDLLQSRWTIQPVNTMIDSNNWDDECRDVLVRWMSDDAVVDAVAIFSFGAYYSSGRETIEALCGWDFFSQRVNARLSSQSKLNDSLEVSLTKALRG